MHALMNSHKKAGLRWCDVISEKTIERQIINYLWSQRILCTKIDTTGIYDEKKKTFRAQRGLFKRRGVSDIVGIYKGRFLSIEVKSAKGRLSEEQSDWLYDVEEHGGIAIVARSVDDVVEALALVDDSFNQYNG
jgi:penicillin-binding protein-related factor A (putative recombinase)